MKWYTGHALAGFMDFGVGTLIAGIIAIVSGGEVSVLFLVLGGVAALLPDFDLIIPILRRKIVGNHRRTLMHRPLFLVPPATALAFALGGPLFAALGVCVLWHYVHDSYGGGSIAWLWPLSEKMFSFSGTVIADDHTPEQHLSYLRRWCEPSSTSVREIAIGSIALTVAPLLAIPHLWWIGPLLVVKVWISVAILWTSAYMKHGSASQ